MKAAAKTLAAVAALLCGPALPRAQASDPLVTGRAEMLAEVAPGGPIEGELVLLRLRAIRKGPVTLEELRQPALTDLSWSQLGRDTTYEEQYQGFVVPGVERVLAIFPQRPGLLVIDPFVLHMTVLDASGGRVEMDMKPQPLTLYVQKIPPEAAGKLWLPASAVTLSDQWDQPPDALAQGALAHRTLRIAVRGLTADRLPPPPLLRAPGVIAYAYPAQRSTEITPQGPVAQAIYQWDIKPVSQDVAELPPVEIAWFDTRARQMRVASVGSVKVKLLSAVAVARRVSAQAVSLAASPLALLGMVGGACLWGLAALALWRRARGAAGRRRLLKPF